MKKNNDIKIAGNLTINNWQELNDHLNSEKDENWGLAFHFFEERIRTRYLNPIHAILKMEDNLGEGFAVVNLQCSLIETIESFINGWISEFDLKFKKPIWKKDGLIVKYPNSNSTKNLGNCDIFISFFTNREPFSELKINGTDFFRSVRCGLLHETQTKNGWKIRAYQDGKSIDNKIIYRKKFQQDIETVIENYKKFITINDGNKTIELRKNFKEKFNHICIKSEEK